MCGLMGFFCVGEERVARHRFQTGLNRLNHRGPDDWGIVAFARQAGGSAVNNIGAVAERKQDVPETATGYLGHHRLSILDLSAAGRQPMFSHDQRLFVVTNGEIYNFVELRATLSTLGYVFRTGTDTEVVLNAYTEWGTECFSRFNGMWAIAIVDLESQEIILSRDRFGVKPLYISQSKTQLGFASEIKALLASRFVKPLARVDVVHEFLVDGKLPFGRDTFFDQVLQLQAGSYQRYSLRNLSLLEDRRWWEITPTPTSSQFEVDEWKEIFFDSLRIRMRSDVPVGACLSGGIDSSAIVCGIASQQRHAYDFRTFTSCYRDPAYDERYFADRVVNHVGATPHWVYPGEETSLLGDLEDLVDVQGEPFPTLSIYSQYCVMRRANEAGIKVLLDGQGADELFVGYDYALAIQLALHLRSLRFSKVLKQIASLRAQRVGLSYRRLLPLIAVKLLPGIRAARNRIRSKEFLSRAGQMNDAARRSQDRLPDNLFEARKRWVEQHPLPNLLRYEDRNSMAFSIETRLPFLDYRLVNCSFGLSESAVNRDGWTKYVVRQSMNGAAPSDVMWRKSKMGFPAPTLSFMLDNREYFLKLFGDDACSKPLIDIEKLRERFSAGDIQDWYWRFVSLELWMRAFDVEL